MPIQNDGKLLLQNKVDTDVSKVRLVIDCYIQSTLDTTEVSALQDITFTNIASGLSMSGDKTFTITLGSFDYKEVVGVELTNTDGTVKYVEGSFTNGFGFFSDGQFTLSSLIVSFT